MARVESSFAHTRTLADPIGESPRCQSLTPIAVTRRPARNNVSHKATARGISSGSRPLISMVLTPSGTACVHEHATQAEKG
jgi:hypothetical protein